MGEDRKPTGETPAQVTAGDVLTNLHAHEKKETWQLWLQTLGIVATIGAMLIGGARYVVVGAWAQAKEHADGGLAVMEAKLEAHILEEAASRQVVLEQVRQYRTELWEQRVEIRAIYLYMKTGQEQRILEVPVPPPADGGR